MSRAEQLKPGDVSLGQAYEFIRAFGAAGGTDRMFQTAIESSQLMHQFVTSCEVRLTQKVQEAMPIALRDAAKRGVSCENGIYRFFDPGFSVNGMRMLCNVSQEWRMYLNDRSEWYDLFHFANRKDEPQERIIRIPIRDSFDKTESEQDLLLMEGEELPSVREVVTFIIVSNLANHVRHLEETYVRCLEKRQGKAIYVGRFNQLGIRIVERPDVRSPKAGAAASRKILTSPA